MDVRRFLDSLRTDPEWNRAVAHVEHLPSRAARYGELSRPLPAPLPGMLETRRLSPLYSHQVEAIEHARRGADTVVVTGTASGKSLCYNLPVLEGCLEDPESTSIYLFPTKALCQDQLGTLQDLLSDHVPLETGVRPAIYDGDTPTATRRRIKAECNLLLTNPDMLHVGILPHHSKWGRFLSNVRFVVIDEIHTYRGIFGANVACMLRRLIRICRHYGANPVFLCASATVANPGELGERLLGRPVQVVDDDGAPRGGRTFILWNPPFIDHDRFARHSASDEATRLMAEMMHRGARTLAFTRTRQAAELVYRAVRDALDKDSSPSAKRIRAYRGGYLPQERREIEQQLFDGDLTGVVSTNALELGIDVGSLDAAILVGYPGTIASTWQQAGRAGRRSDESLAVLIAQNDPIDQYLMRHPEFLFGQSCENAVLDAENPYILQGHLRAAAFELPVGEPDGALFGPLTLPIAQALRDAEQLNEVAGRFYATSPQSPSLDFSLRHMSNNTFAIVQRMRSDAPPPEIQNEFRSPTDNRPAIPPGHRVIANVDAISAPELVYPEAVYLHDGETYLVRSLDLAAKIATVDRFETGYYTQAVLESSVRIQKQRAGCQCTAFQAFYGDMDVSWKTVAFKKIKFDTRENLGMGPVDIPGQTLTTTGFWVVAHASVLQQVQSCGWRPTDGLVGVRNLLIQSLPLVAMCDARDISGQMNSSNLGVPTVIVYDRYPGGLGYCEKGYALIDQLLAIALDMIERCPCYDGCPSCVGLPNLRPAIHSDPDLSRGYPVPSKEATRLVLRGITQYLASDGGSHGVMSLECRE
jgi:DEAD/DEAH box helicase domain-containing protein